MSIFVLAVARFLCPHWSFYLVK